MGSKNFKYLDELIHSGVNEIVLDSDITLSDGEVLKYRDGIRLDVDEFAIDGNGHTVDARGRTRIFCCTGKMITLKNIILKNGYAGKNGGAIHNMDGELSIIESAFTGSEAHNGGAIFSNDALTITDSAFTQNKAQGCGGAICELEGKLTISDSSLTGNIASWGGAICNELSETTITGSTISQNTAKLHGGAIDQGDGELTITESALNNNMATRSGGAICNSLGDVTIIKSALDNNVSQKNGGAISNGCVLTIIESALTHNTAKLIGGAVCNSCGFSTSTIKKSTLNNNVAQAGGAICNEEGLSTLTIKESALNNNVAQKRGGAIYLKKLAISFESQDCTFNGNEPDDVSEYDSRIDSEWISRKIVFR